MLGIICPLYVEAEGLIQKLGLKKKQIFKGYECFADDEQDIFLMISGTGKLNAAAAGGVLLSHLACDHLVVFGSCAGLKGQPAGSLYMIHKITDIDTGSSYYPDMTGEQPFAEASLLCGSQVYGQNSRRDLPVPFDMTQYMSGMTGSEYSLYDMESSGFYHAAMKYLGPHQIHILRTVTDYGNGIDRKQMTEIMRKAAMQCAPYLKSLAVDKEEKKEKKLTGIAELFCCSVSMRAQLKQILQYAECAQVKWQKIIEGMKQDEILPAVDRETGKKALYEFERKVIS